MDPNALLTENEEERVQIEAFGRSVKDVKATLIHLLAVEKELSKRLDSLTFLHNAKTEARKHVHVSVLDGDSFSFASPSSWKFRTPSPAQTRSSHHRVWSVTTTHSPAVSEFHAPVAKSGRGWCCFSALVLLSVCAMLAILWRLRASLVVV